jgi:hypothetical protein
MQTVRLAPPYSQIHVMDPSSREPVKWNRGSRLSATPSIVAIGTLAEVDGETEIRFGHDKEVDPGTAPAYVGLLNTPTGVVSVRTAEDKELLSLKVNRERVTLRVWTNDPSEPTLVCVGVS